MRRKWSTITICLLVAVVVLGGVTGCERKAETRPTNTPESEEPGTLPTSPSGGEPSATPQPTRVSVLVTPGAGEEPTVAPGGETPAVVEPTAVPPGETPVVVEPTAMPPEPTTPPATGETWHTVKRGETLSTIAAQYGTTWQAIAKANNLVNPNQIYTGQKLKIPTGGSSGGTSPGCRYHHTVKQGEWIWQIARSYGVDPYDLMAANGLTLSTADPLYAGTRLCIP